MAFRLRPAERGFYPLFSRAGKNILAATADLARMVAAEQGARAGLAGGSRMRSWRGTASPTTSSSCSTPPSSRPSTVRTSTG